MTRANGFPQISQVAQKDQRYLRNLWETILHQTFHTIEPDNTSVANRIYVLLLT